MPLNTPAIRLARQVAAEAGIPYPATFVRKILADYGYRRTVEQRCEQCRKGQHEHWLKASDDAYYNCTAVSHLERRVYDQIEEILDAAGPVPRKDSW